MKISAAAMDHDPIIDPFERRPTPNADRGSPLSRIVSHLNSRSHAWRHEDEMEHATEIRRLHRCIDDLIGVVALAAAGTGQDPAQLVGPLLDALVSMLHLDFAYASLSARVATTANTVGHLGTVAGHKQPARAAPRSPNGDGAGGMAIADRHMTRSPTTRYGELVDSPVERNVIGGW